MNTASIPVVWVHNIENWIHDSTLKLYTIANTVTTRYYRAIEFLTNRIAVEILAQAFISLPFYYLYNNLFMVCLPLGVIFPHQIERIHQRVTLIAKHHLWLVGLSFPFWIKGMTGALIVATVYCSARLAALVYLDSKKRELIHRKEGGSQEGAYLSEEDDEEVKA